MDLTQEQKKRLVDLQKKTKEASEVAVVRKSIALMEWFVEHKENGGRVVLVDKDNKDPREMILLF